MKTAFVVLFVLLASPAWAQPRWSASTISYVANVANQDGIPEAEVHASLQRARAIWAAVAKVPTLVYAGATTALRATRNGISEVIYVRGRSLESYTRAASGYYWYDGTGFITEMDIEFYDEAWRFVAGSGACVNGTDTYLDDITTHELGHGLGLHHNTADLTATMATYMQGTSCSQGWRTLEAADRTAILSLYSAQTQLLLPAPINVRRAP